MHEVTSNKSQFLIFEINWLSNDLFFFSLNSHNGFIMPLVSFLFPLREKRKCRKPTWNAILIKIFRLFSQKWCWPGWEKDKENGFISSIWFFKMYSSTGRESISSLEKEKKKTVKKGNNFKAWHPLFSEIRKPQDMEKSKRERILCAFF